MVTLIHTTKYGRYNIEVSFSKNYVVRPEMIEQMVECEFEKFFTEHLTFINIAENIITNYPISKVRILDSNGIGIEVTRD